MGGVPDWQEDCLTLLLKTSEELSKPKPQCLCQVSKPNHQTRFDSNELPEILKYLRSAMRNLQTYTSENKARIQLQLDNVSKYFLSLIIENTDSW